MKYLQKTDYNDLDKILALINTAYRGLGGERRWTTEAHLIEGDRLDQDGLRALISSDNSQFYVGYLANEPACCITITQYGKTAEFGCFAVDPNLHGLGYGKALLNFAEACARPYSTLFQVTVVSQNTQLLDFYKRRAYVDTGQTQAYPTQQNVGKPKIPNIELRVLQKKV